MNLHLHFLWHFILMRDLTIKLTFEEGLFILLSHLSATLFSEAFFKCDFFFINFMDLFIYMGRLDSSCCTNNNKYYITSLNFTKTDNKRKKEKRYNSEPCCQVRISSLQIKKTMTNIRIIYFLYNTMFISLHFWTIFCTLMSK